MVLRLLLEGNSVSSIERLTEVHHTTVLKLLVLAGEKCERIMAEKIRNVEVRDVEADEVWSYWITNCINQHLAHYRQRTRLGTRALPWLV